MTITLESLARDIHDILAADDSPAGRQRVAMQLGEALRDPAFVAAQFAGSTGERKVLHEDPQLHFCVLAHDYQQARAGSPHDHGPTWAIYGQAGGESVMTEFEVVEPPAAGQRGRVRELRSYTMRPGDSRVYDEGVIHAVRHPGPSRLVRIEGRDLAGVKRGVYDIAAQ
jgi:hypothetical protein